jgi:hypothetical protein
MFKMCTAKKWKRGGRKKKGGRICRREEEVGHLGRNVVGTCDRVKAGPPPHKGFSVVLWWGALSKEGKKLGRWKANIRFPVSSPSALIKR